MIIEVCIDNIRSAIAAKAGGADRLEVCGPLSVGGTTPSAGLIEQCVELGGIDVVTMIRPHAGDFCYDSADIETMLRDIRIAKRLGAQGVVFGALTTDRHIDIETCRSLIDEARPMAVTFHRAFDVVDSDNAQSAMDSLLQLKVDRLLTSGLATTAVAGSESIRKLVQQSADKIKVIAASGVNADNAAQLIAATGVTEIHASSAQLSPPTGYAIDFGGKPRTTCESKVRNLRNAVT